MKEYIRERIARLRDKMAEKGMSAIIVPSTDPHLSEYVADHWQARKWISGFTGSAGTVVITGKKGGLWTDSRYFLQAEEQLKGSGIDLYKVMIQGTPSVCEFISSELNENEKVAIDAALFSTIESEELKKCLSVKKIDLVDCDIISEIWSDRPAMPRSIPYIYSTEFAGEPLSCKIKRIRKAMIQAESSALLISALDEIAWTLNLRAEDVHCNPVAVSFLYITKDEAHFFIENCKLTDEVREYLVTNGISIHECCEIYSFLKARRDETVMADLSKTNYKLYLSINEGNRIVDEKSPVSLFKAIRNETEIKGLRSAMVKDGVALTKFLMWLEKAVPRGEATELSIEKKLAELRAQQPLFKGVSFDTIAGYKEHGAIVHYQADEESNATLQEKGFVLIDSGAQYLDGTTDITRTIAVGELSEEEKRDYTLTLKGTIDLAMAVFPENTRGTQLDILARLPMWRDKKNFLHGTGHGVGHFLNVHEGPQSIRMNENPQVIVPGMLTSDEPGIYIAGSHGIRIENLLLCIPYGEGLFGDYYTFETVTLCPICTKGIILEMLSREEREWLNSYHQSVFEKLQSHLTREEKAWLKEATKPI